MMTLTEILDSYRAIAKSEREKGTYFERLFMDYLSVEPVWKDLYEKVWMYADWAREQGIDARDAGIDLVARTMDGDFHAIQCKLYDKNYHLQKSDIDSFFTASGRKPFVHRIIVSTTNHWSVHAEAALVDQQPPVTKIDLHSLEESIIDWSRYKPGEEVVGKTKKVLRKHQDRAVEAVLKGFESADRGKLLMACGTGKTFTSLKIAEKLIGSGGYVLFLVPSLNLLSQTLTEWTQESAIPLHNFAVCSDSDVGKKRIDDDIVRTLIHELQYPATTDSGALAREVSKRGDQEHITVVYSTYHSIGVVSEAQLVHGLPAFDLVVCDEAHRTTGATFGDEDESAFVRVHDNTYLQAKKRLYMTATPRIYADSAKAKAEQDSVTLCSMDDETLYGKELHIITFSDAVRQDLLVDYKVLVLAVEENHVSRRLQKLLSAEDNQLKVDDAAKIIGCWKALAKQGLAEDLTGDENPMKRAVAFCHVIEPSGGKSKTHKVSSKNIASIFQRVVEAYQDAEKIEPASRLRCEARHVDGSMNASQKQEKLDWLKAEPIIEEERNQQNKDIGANELVAVPNNEQETDFIRDSSIPTCRILSNVRCLSEGVDVPALDAVLFLTPRNSQIDVVQSVGRVMRKSPGKKRGYVILPVVIPAGMEAHEALADNKTYAVVWQVLQALRSHDDRFDAMINRMDLDLNRSVLSKMEIVAVSDKAPKKRQHPMAEKRGGLSGPGGRSGFTIGSTVTGRPDTETQTELQFEIGEIERAIYAKVVKKCGNRHHWEEWANDIARIARTHIDRITGILENQDNASEREAFAEFAKGLRDDLNESITDSEVIEMLAQHLVTKPVFNALFADYNFASQNPISQAMQKVLDTLNEHRLEKEVDTLESFYVSVRERAQGIDNASGKQKIIVELYDKFFRNAFPRMTERLGIVYTPVEVVDFIIHSVDHLLQKHFNLTLGSPGVHILDPFTGTGTFITRLLLSGLIPPEQLPYKFKNEIHANEIVLLAYYIAAINIEAVYRSIVGGEYTPFEGICLTDTFQIYEKEDLISEILVDNSTRLTKQKALDIRVIIGNPPYSSGDKDDNNNKNMEYYSLDKRIAETYIEKSSRSMGKSKMYDSYIRAIRWASDRIGQSGLIGYVSGSGFIEKPAMDGIRKCLIEEFSSLYVFNLRGDIRKNILSKGQAKEGQNIFAEKSMTGIAITIFAKKPHSENMGQIFYYDIGDDLTTQQKLDRISQLADINGISSESGWTSLEPDKFGDWINQRDTRFTHYIPIGSKSKKECTGIFSIYSMGLKTNRDEWTYNFSKQSLVARIGGMIDFYNSEVHRFKESSQEKKSVEIFVSRVKTKIKWTSDVLNDLSRGRYHTFVSEDVVQSLYRPYSKEWVYANKTWNWTRHLMPRIFPNLMSYNYVICLSGVGAQNSFSALITDTVPNLHTIQTGQCFPLYIYEETSDKSDSPSLFDEPQKSSIVRQDGITDESYEHFKKTYLSETFNKEDIFYYVYGLLHSKDYRSRFADNLTKELPRIPCVKKAKDFWSFSKAGRELAEIHIGYETVEPYKNITINICNGAPEDPIKKYHVEKMKYGKIKESGKTIDDKTTLIYNPWITLTGIPLSAYEYIVNGKSALDWVVERQCVKTDKDSGIENDANKWANETIGTPRYPLDLFLRVVTVSLETNRIVNELPKMDI